MQLGAVHECVNYQAKFTQHPYESNKLALPQIPSPRSERHGIIRKPSRSQALQSMRFSHFNEVKKCTLQRLQKPHDEENFTTTYTYTCQTLTATSQRLLSCCTNLYTETVVQLTKLQMGAQWEEVFISPLHRLRFRRFPSLRCLHHPAPYLVTVLQEWISCSQLLRGCMFRSGETGKHPRAPQAGELLEWFLPKPVEIQHSRLS